MVYSGIRVDMRQECHTLLVLFVVYRRYMKND